MSIALVLGGTGLVGKALTQALLADDQWHEVHLFLRRSTGIKHSKLQEHIIGFDLSESWQPFIKGDVLFSALGTTIKTAGSKDAQYKVDFTYQYNFAKTAASNGVERYCLVSAAGASAKSLFFYNRMKGELEDAIEQLPFSHTSIMKPGLLDGPRTEHRSGERMALSVFKTLHSVIKVPALQPIKDVEVAKAMIAAATKQTERLKKYSHKEMLLLARQ